MFVINIVPSTDCVKTIDARHHKEIKLVFTIFECEECLKSWV